MVRSVNNTALHQGAGNQGIMIMGTNTGVSVNQSGKSGGDASGIAGSGAGAMGGCGSGYGSASVFNADPIGLGVGVGGSAGAGSGAVGAMGGDVSDNTSIGSININS